jgi:hypothetical protein
MIVVAKLTHGCAETTVDLENGKLVEAGSVNVALEVRVRDNLGCIGRLDTLPVTDRHPSQNEFDAAAGWATHMSTFLARSER